MDEFLRDQAFTDFLSKYLSLPLFGQTLAVTPNGQFQYDTTPTENDKVKQWIVQNRWSFFEKSRIFAQYKLARFLMNVKLDEHVDEAQSRLFNKISAFADFCSFLERADQTQRGITLVRYFVDVHVYMASLDWRLHDQIRTTYLNPGHRKCLGSQLLKHLKKNDITKKSLLVDICVEVVSRLATYWLPRYLLHLRGFDFSEHTAETLTPVSRLSVVTMLPNTTSKPKRIRPFYQGRAVYRSTPLTTTIIGDEDQDCDLFTHMEDFEYRKKFAYYRNALFIDHHGGGPFRAFLTSHDKHDQLACLTLWTELERLRTSFVGLEQIEVIREKKFLMKFFSDPEYNVPIPQLLQHKSDMMQIRLEGCLAFPWQLRKLQKHCMERLYTTWIDYELCDVNNFAQLTTCQYTTVSQLEERFFSFFHPLSKPTIMLPRAKTACRKRDIPVKPVLARAQTTIGRNRASVPINNEKTNEMIQRTQRAFSITGNIEFGNIHSFINNVQNFESDDEGAIKPVKPPTFVRQRTYDSATLARLSSKQYPLEGPPVYRQRRTLIRKKERAKTPSYLKQSIRKNGATIKRPVVRPKHLAECIRDPIHLEFFRRFAKEFKFEQLIRFWRGVESMKEIDDPHVQQAKIISICNTFFPHGTNGLGIDAQVLKDLSRTEPEKATIAMVVSAQTTVMKVMEERWGEKYLSTFASTRSAVFSRLDKPDFLSGKSTSENKRTRSVWTMFFSFFRRSAIFIKYMKVAKTRKQFELFLSTIGRDPKCYRREGWSDIKAVQLDSGLTHDIVYHRRRHNGSYIVGEFVLNDFRFWREIECFKRQAVYLSNSSGYNAGDEEMLRDKARLICDQFLSSPILPKCRVNVTVEMASNVIEKVKLGMIDATLFYECATRVFPLLIHHWSHFANQRHQYVPKRQLVELRRRLVLQKRRDKLSVKVAKPIMNMDNTPLIDYNEPRRFHDCWHNASKTLDDTPVVSFSLSTGMRVTLPIKPATTATMVNSSSIGGHSRIRMNSFKASIKLSQ